MEKQAGFSYGWQGSQFGRGTEGQAEMKEKAKCSERALGLEAKEIRGASQGAFISHSVAAAGQDLARRSGWNPGQEECTYTDVPTVISP